MVKSSPANRVLFAVALMLFLTVLAFASGFVVASFQPRRFQAVAPRSAAPTAGPLSVFQETWDLVSRDFFGTLPSSRERAYGAVRSLLNTLGDPYTVLVEPIPRQLEQGDLRGSHGGIGVTLTRDADGQVVLTPLRDSPAAAAGILEGDVLVLVDALVITPDMDVANDIEARIRGDEGTDVTLAIRRGGETISFTIARQVIVIPSVTWQILKEAPSLGYVKVGSFTDRTASELQGGLEQLLAEGASGLILDLRDNGGGLLQASVDVADLFLDGGVVLYETGRSPEERSFLANEGELAPGIPLVVLVNHGTASASEIVAGAIQDRGRGLLIGEPTFGKGSVQLIFDLSDGSSLHITAARWYTPDHHQLDGDGLAPDLIAETSSEDDVDTQLAQAISVLLRGEQAKEQQQ